MKVKISDVDPGERNSYWLSLRRVVPVEVFNSILVDYIDLNRNYKAAL